MTDENGSVRGVMGDILNIITLQTGLNFSPITVSHNIHAGTQQPRRMGYNTWRYL